jgi:pteridine reductase
MKLTGKVTLVTGAARRVGRAIALELATAGATLAIHHHAAGSGEAAEGLRQQVVAAGGAAAVFRADLREAAAAEALMAQVRETLGPVAVLVNSAADFERLPFVDQDDARWESMLALNLLAPMRLSRALARQVAQAVADGAPTAGPAAEPTDDDQVRAVIVNILDVGAYQAWPGYAHYCVSKAGLAMLTRLLAVELGPHLRVAGVAPGTVLYPEYYDDAERKKTLAKTPLGRVGTPEDVARAVRFLVEQGGFISGAVLPVDGGRLSWSHGAT